MIDPRWPDLQFETSDREKPDLPTALWQCDAMIGYGWQPGAPHDGCYTRRHKSPRFADIDMVVKWVTNLDRLPSHHRLIAIHRCSPTWRPVSLAELPDPIRYDPSEEDWQ